MPLPATIIVSSMQEYTYWLGIGAGKWRVYVCWMEKSLSKLEIYEPQRKWKEWRAGEPLENPGSAKTPGKSH